MFTEYDDWTLDKIAQTNLDYRLPVKINYAFTASSFIISLGEFRLDNYCHLNTYAKCSYLESHVSVKWTFDRLTIAIAKVSNSRLTNRMDERRKEFRGVKV